MAKMLRLPNGFGNISKLPGNRRKPFRARVCVQCTLNKETERIEQKYKNIGYYETYQDALIALTEYHKNPYDIDASKITFKEVFEKWSAEHFPKVSRSNVNGYNASFKLCGDIEKLVFADIRLNHLQGVIDNCGKNYPTLRKVKVLFNSMYGWAMKHDICAKDYSEFVDISQYKDKNPNKIDRFPFTDEEIKTMWNWSTKNEYVSIFLMLIYTGVRQGELRDLKKEDVHLEERYFYIRESKTPAGIRNVPIAKKVLPFFQYWMNKESKCEYLITTREGRYFYDRNFRDSYWTVVLNDMGLNPLHHPHDTRHTCVSLLTKAGVDERIIKKIVGHAGKGVTEIVYTHVEMQQLLEAIDKIRV